jgi:hypothetical protein
MFDASAVEAMAPGPELAAVLFSAQVAELDAEQTRVWVAASQRLEACLEACRYAAVAHYADLHPPVEEADGPQQIGGEASVAPGGDGTPAMGEFAVTELAVGASCSSGRAWGLLADGLDLRHRMPRLFAELAAGRVSGFKVRMILRAARGLGLFAARLLDARIAAVAGKVGPKRLAAMIEQVLIEVDPDAAAERAASAKATRRVGVGPASDGERQLFGYVDAFHGLAFDAALDRVADMLGDLGDTDPKEVRRASAVGWLANPVATLALQARHAAWAAGTAPPAWTTTIVPEQTSLDDLDDQFGGCAEPDADGYAAAAAASAAGTDASGFARVDAGPPGGTHPHLRPGLWPTDTPTPADLIDHRLWPAATVVVHIDAETWQTGAGTAELSGHGPITATAAFDRLRHHQITIKPVIDLNDHLRWTSDADEFTGQLREAIFLAHPWNPFPYADAQTKSGETKSGETKSGEAGDDADHTIPRNRHGPTALGNGAPLRRRLHRFKTHARGWQVRQPFPGIHLWQSPHGRIYLLDRRGHTHDLGLPDTG